LLCRGRQRIQLLGFTMVSILFFISAAKYPTLVKPNNIGVFQFIYFFSSFWGQVSIHCTWRFACRILPAFLPAYLPLHDKLLHWP
jgi:hypothetical protein